VSSKEFLTADGLVRDAFTLAEKIYSSGYRPDAVLVIWRGGTPIGIVIHEYLRFKGVDTYHGVVKAESYTGIEQRIEPRIMHREPLMADINADSHILLIDDIFDSGRTIETICERLSKKHSTVKVATLYYKEANNQTSIEPDFYLRKTDDWIVFPHELMGLSEGEIEEKDAYIKSLLDGDAGPSSPS
jgi:uncharacterized protein